MSENIRPGTEEERCQALTAKGQCRSLPAPGSAFCPMHCGFAIHQRQQAKAATRNYALTTLKARVDKATDSSALFSLREEVAILRIMLETKLNAIKDESDLWMQSQQISDLVIKIDKLVTSCAKQEVSMGQMLDRSTLANIAQQLVAILTEHCSPEVLDVITDKIKNIFEGVENASV